MSDKEENDSQLDDDDLSSTSLLYELIEATPDSSFLHLTFEEKKERQKSAMGMSIFSPRESPLPGISHDKGEKREFTDQTIPIPSAKMTFEPRATSLRGTLDDLRMPLMTKLGLANDEKHKWRGRPSVYVKELLDFMDRHSDKTTIQRPSIKRKSPLLIGKDGWERKVSKIEGEEGEEYKSKKKNRKGSVTSLTPERSLEHIASDSLYAPFGKLDYLKGRKTVQSEEVHKNVLETHEKWDSVKTSFDEDKDFQFRPQSIYRREKPEKDPGLWERELSIEISADHQSRRTRKLRFSNEKPEVIPLKIKKGEKKEEDNEKEEDKKRKKKFSK